MPVKKAVTYEPTRCCRESRLGSYFNRGRHQLVAGDYYAGQWKEDVA